MSEFERLSTPPASPFPDKWYRADHADHFWFRWRLRALRAALARHAIPEDRPLKAIDVGCGMGVVRSQLEKCTRWTVDGADLSPFALAHQLPSRGRTMLYDVRDESPELLGRYDVALAFDVLEHVKGPTEFLVSLSRHLRHDGLLIVNVPALQWLFSSYDSAQGHRRRYRVRDLLEEIEAARTGFTCLEASYWGLSLVPLAYARKLFLGQGSGRERSLRVGFNQPSRILQATMTGMMLAETALCSRPPLGTSVLAIFRKNSTK